MIRMQGPLREQLDTEPSDERVARVAQAVAERRRSRTTHRGPWAMGTALAIAAGVAGALLWWATSGGLERGAAAAPGVIASVLRVHGAVVEAQPAHAVRFAETPEAMVFTLGVGERIALDVPPGTGLAWVVDAAWARVEVVGTQFVVERFVDRVAVDVSRGRVQVTSPALPEGARYLAAGDHLEISARHVARAVAQARGGPASGEGRSASTGEAPIEGSRGASRPADAPTALPDRPNQATLDALERATAAERAARRVASAARAPGGARATHDAPSAAPTRDLAADLLAQADAERAAGRYAQAVLVLERLARDHPADPRAGLAIFTAARIEQDQLGHPRTAADALERALAQGLPEELREDARARRFEAYLAVPDKVGALRAATDYLAHHPRGRRAAAARAIASP